jgi:two-component system, cell cycle sensor histidine kinase and response regulator CckA
VEVHDASERARALTRQLLALSRQQRIHVSSVPVADVLTRTAALLQRVLGGHIAVTLHLERADLMAEADAGAMEQMLLNLAVNARDAMPAGGALHLEAVSRPFLATAVPGITDLARPHVIISVSDTGSGIAPEVVQHIFDPFFTTKEVGKGTGLGLAMVQSLAGQMRGAVTVESAQGTGSTFRIFLPAAQSATVTAATALPVIPDGHRRATILLVEDDAPLRRVAVRALRDARFTVHEAGEVSEALRVYDQFADDIDALVTDVVLPRESGPMLVRSLRGRRPGLPVLYITGFSTSEQLVQDVDAGTPMLAKPFDMRELVSEVARLVESATSTQVTDHIASPTPR